MWSTTIHNESETQRNLRFNLSVTALTKPYQERSSSRVTRLIKTAWKLINLYLREPTGTVSPMIFFLSILLCWNSCDPKIADFFPSCLGYWQVFGACHYFPSPWRWAGETVIFSIRSSVISNKPALANISSFSDKLSLKRWCLIRCAWISELHQSKKSTKSVSPRLLSHLPPEMLENNHNAAILQSK